ncbi:MAG: molybdopterin containing oxidoreductase, partial [Microvirga sp.]
VDLSVDGGRTWTQARCDPLRNRYDWTRWTAELGLPSDGSFEILARATDADGRRQPLEPENRNPGGYACNAVHRVVVRVG